MKRILLISLIVIVSLLVIVEPVAARALTQEPPQPPDFLTFLTEALAYLTNLGTVFATLAGVAALVAVVVDFAKRLGLPDGQAPKVAFWLNAALFVVLGAVGLFAHITPQQFDQFAAALATILTVILGFVWQVILSPKIHNALKEGHVPVLTYSQSMKSTKP